MTSGTLHLLSSCDFAQFWLYRLISWPLDLHGSTRKERKITRTRTSKPHPNLKEIIDNVSVPFTRGHDRGQNGPGKCMILLILREATVY